MELTKGLRLGIGVLVLLLVDIVWVGSSELSKYIFNDTGYNKPFFSTYLKTSMFSLYLLGFLFWKPWQQQCVEGRDIVSYQGVDLTPSESFNGSASMSGSSYEPIKIANSEKSSDAESDDSSIKSVRFSRLAEVRQLSETDGIEAMLSRLSFTASQRVDDFSATLARGRLSIQEVAKISLFFCILWFVGNYSYQLAISQTEVGVVNVISSTSGLFTLILAAIFPSSPTDKFTLSKFMAVIFMILGTILISIDVMDMDKTVIPTGIFFSLLGSIFYACYMVFLRRKVPSEENMDFSMFFGFVGLFNALLLWPAFLLLNSLDVEIFSLPNRNQLLYILVNGLVGTVISELLWLWGCFLTSSLMATLSLTLVIPLTMVFDIVIRKVHYSWLFYAGSFPIIFSFVFVTILTHFAETDPVLDGLKYFSKLCFNRHKDYRLVSIDVNEEESLIVSGDLYCEEINTNNGLDEAVSEA